MVVEFDDQGSVGQQEGIGGGECVEEGFDDGGERGAAWEQFDGVGGGEVGIVEGDADGLEGLSPGLGAVVESFVLPVYVRQQVQGRAAVFGVVTGGGGGDGVEGVEAGADGAESRVDRRVVPSEEGASMDGEARGEIESPGVWIEGVDAVRREPLDELLQVNDHVGGVVVKMDGMMATRWR
jgi:hypothetical protein